MSKLIRIRIVEFLVEFLEKYLFYEHFPKFLKLSIFHVISHFVIEIRVHWQKLNQERASEINIWTHKSKYLKSNDFERKKSITIHHLFGHEKLPRIMFISNTYLIFKNILVNTDFLNKMSVPYCKSKSQLFHILDLVHPRKISLAESRGSIRFSST